MYFSVLVPTVLLVLNKESDNNMDKFPSELPLLAVRQLFKFVKREDQDLGKAALAAWQVLGYAGHLAFGDAQFLAGDEPIAQTGPIDYTQLLTEAEQSGAIPPALIDIAVSIIVRIIKRRLNK